MSIGGLALVAFLMAVGFVGVLLPGVPGLVLIWGAGLWWVLADGGGVVRWTVLTLMTMLLAAGTLAKYVLPARAASGAGAPLSSLLIGAVCAFVGFFVIPVVGAPIGGIGGIYLAEWARLGDTRTAAVSTRAALVGFGIGVLLELIAGLAMAGTWLVGEIVT